MKRLSLILLFCFCSILPVFSEVVIRLKNGQTINLQINHADISSIDFNPVQTPGTAAPKPATESAVRLIRTLRVIEYARDKSPAWNGVLTRIGESSNFQADWKNIKTGQSDKAVLTMQSRPGEKQVTLIRNDNKQTYTGSISPDGLSLEGTFNEPGKAVRDRRWTAQIEY